MKLTIVETRQESPTVKTFLFSSDPPVTWLPGQHVSMRIPHENPDNRGMVRQFSVSSSPTEKYLTITTRQGVSTLKKALFAMKPGEAIDGRGPGGIFTWTGETPALYLAGGIGVTPLRSMAVYKRDKKIQTPLNVLYSAKTREELVFKELFSEMAKTDPTFHIIYTITEAGEAKEKGAVLWDRIGRIDETLLKESLNGMPIPGIGGTLIPGIGARMVYMAGPGVFVEAMKTLALSLGIPADRLRSETFPGYA